MGLIFSKSLQTEVPDEVKQKVEPIQYTSAPESAREHGGRLCPCCTEPYFFFFTPRTNCDWCGGEFCTNCCPNRYLLGGKPGCPTCTQRAFVAKRQELLEDHLSCASYKPPAQVEFS